MNQTGYTVLKIPKTGAAFAYAKEARDFATGATAEWSAMREPRSHAKPGRAAAEPPALPRHHAVEN